MNSSVKLRRVRIWRLSVVSSMLLFLGGIALTTGPVAGGAVATSARSRVSETHLAAKQQLSTGKLTRLDRRLFLHRVHAELGKAATRDEVATAETGDTNVTSATNPQIVFVTASDGWQIGGKVADPAWNEGFEQRSFQGSVWPGSTIESTTDGGNTWSVEQSVAGGVWGLDFVGQSYGWAVGVDQLLATSNGGTSWNAIGEPPVPLTYVSFTSNTSGVGTTASGALFQTSDGGLTWQDVNGAPVSTLSACQSIDSSLLAVRADGAVRTEDGASSAWTTVYSPADASPDFANVGQIMSAQISCNGEAVWVAEVLNYNPDDLTGEDYFVASSANGGDTWNASVVRTTGTLQPQSTASSVPSGLPSNLGWLAPSSGNTAYAVGNNLLDGSIELLSIQVGPAPTSSVSPLPALGDAAANSVGPSFGTELAAYDGTVWVGATVSAAQVDPLPIPF